MTIVQQIIKRQYSNNNKFNEFIDKCMQIKELDLYLHNLDMQADLYENGNLSVMDIKKQDMLDRQNIQLVQLIESKLVKIIINEDMDDLQIMHNTNQLKLALGEEDMLELEQAKVIPAYKLYTIAKIVCDILHLQRVKEKTL